MLQHFWRLMMCKGGWQHHPASIGSLKVAENHLFGQLLRISCRWFFKLQSVFQFKLSDTGSSHNKLHPSSIKHRWLIGMWWCGMVVSKRIARFLVKRPKRSVLGRYSRQVPKIFGILKIQVDMISRCVWTWGSKTKHTMSYQYFPPIKVTEQGFGPDPWSVSTKGWSWSGFV